MRRRTLRAVGTAMAALLACTLTACNDDDPADPKASKSSPDLSAPRPSDELATEALKAYFPVVDKVYREALSYKSVGSLRKDARRELSKVSTGSDLRRLVGNAVYYLEHKVRDKGEYRREVREPKRKGGEYVIRVCEDRSKVKSFEDGKPVPDLTGPDGAALPNPLAIDYTLTTTGGEWLVSDENVLIQGESWHKKSYPC